jgi:diguanylate cyclase (GGDEF)-like protein/PAS domain S-box-containing protein
MAMHTLKLTRNFFLSSLLLIVLAGFLLGTLLRQHEVAQMENLAERRNVSLTQVFRNLLLQDISQLAGGKQDLSKDELKASPLVRGLQDKTSNLLSNSDIVKVKIYNRLGITVFSTDREQLGDDKRTNPAFIAALNGQVSSELVHREQFSSTDTDRHDVDLVSSYVPVHDHGQVVAVFELYQDVTALLQQIDRSQWSIWVAVSSIMIALFLLQLIAVGRMQGLLSAQEALLEASNRELDRRVAERSQQVEALLHQQQIIFDNVHVGILLLQNRIIIKGNQRMAEMFGFSSLDEFVGQSTQIFYGSAERFEAAGRSGYRQLAEKGFATFETPMLRQDGSQVWVMQTGRPVDPSAVLEGVSIWVYTDITELKRAEAEQRIAAVAFDSHEGMVVTDTSGIILRVNKAFSDLTGYAPEELVGRSPNLLRSDRHPPEFYETMRQSIQQTGTWTGEIWNQRKDGEVFPGWLTISAVRDPQGNVTHYVGTHTDITERKISEERIQHLAFFDQLTGLPNRTLLLDRLKQAMAAGQRSQRYGALLFLDLDHFKALNDTAGHDQGDRLLCNVATKLTANVRQCDTVARIGGDEFIIVLAELGVSQVDAAAFVETVCRKLLAALKQNYSISGTEFRCSTSIGATLFLGSDVPHDELLKQADLAMYESKEAGRNSFTFFDQAMGTAVLARIQMESDLRQAIREQQFELYYQPQVDGKDNRVVGAEVLIRWQHPTRGFVLPDAFIPRAEENGQIVPLGLWVLETACSQLAAWADRPDFAPLTISANVSVQQFSQADFVDQLIAILKRTGARPEQLKIELTESLFVANIEDAVRKMTTLKALGVGFSLDDFGTGNSSMAYLSTLPLDQLKIDRSFVMDLERSETNAVICAATISLAHNLRLKVVAEGVESETQQYFLATVHGCDFLQGYLISRPMPLTDFQTFHSARLAALAQHRLSRSA